jgi:hypothetical protein
MVHLETLEIFKTMLFERKEALPEWKGLSTDRELYDRRLAAVNSVGAKIEERLSKIAKDESTPSSSDTVSNIEYSSLLDTGLAILILLTRETQNTASQAATDGAGLTDAGASSIVSTATGTGPPSTEVKAPVSYCPKLMYRTGSIQFAFASQRHRIEGRTDVPGEASREGKTKINSFASDD